MIAGFYSSLQHYRWSVCLYKTVACRIWKRKRKMSVTIVCMIGNKRGIYANSWVHLSIPCDEMIHLTGVSMLMASTFFLQSSSLLSHPSDHSATTHPLFTVATYPSKYNGPVQIRIYTMNVLTTKHEMSPGIVLCKLPREVKGKEGMIYSSN